MSRTLLPRIDIPRPPSYDIFGGTPQFPKNWPIWQSLRYFFELFRGTHIFDPPNAPNHPKNCTCFYPYPARLFDQATLHNLAPVVQIHLGQRIVVSLWLKETFAKKTQLLQVVPWLSLVTTSPRYNVQVLKLFPKTLRKSCCLKRPNFRLDLHIFPRFHDYTIVAWSFPSSQSLDSS